MTTENTIPATPTETVVPELTLNDLTSIKNLIEIVTARGVFKATELTAVGLLFDKLSAFLAASQKAQEPTESQGE